MTQSNIENNQPKRYKLICCEIMFREACHIISSCDSIIDPVFMSKELHDIGQRSMSQKLQEMIDQTDIERYDAILLGYGLCNYGVQGLHAKLPLVIPKAHDCITLLLGSRERYNDYFKENPGTFFKSPGWIERDTDPTENSASVISKMGITHSREELLDDYDEDEAEYLMQIMGNWLSNYSKLVYIDTLSCNTNKFKRQAKQQADLLNLPFEIMEGDTSLLKKLMSGKWLKELFLIIPPGDYIDSDNSDQIICSKALVR